MDSKELHNLHEAYLDVYELDEDGWQPPTQKRADRMMKQASKLHRTASEIAEPPKESIRAEIKHRQASRVYQASRRMSDSAKERDNEAKRKEFVKEDLYDIILSHLLDEGYAETQEAAEAIMVNMSEDWRESIMEGRVAWDDKKNPNPSGYTPKEKSEAKRRQLGVDDPNTSSFEKGGPGEKEYARHGNLAAAQDKMKKRSNQPKGKPHQFKKNPFWKMNLGQVRRKIFGTEVPNDKASSYEGKNMPSFAKK